MNQYDLTNGASAFTNGIVSYHVLMEDKDMIFLDTSSRFALHPTSGFSLIELMVSIAILGILASIAAPSFTNTIKRYQANAARDELVASIQVAQTEARRRGRMVFLSRHTNAAIGCPTATTPASDPWKCWQMSVDTDNSQALDGTEGDAANALKIFTVHTNVSIQATPVTASFNRWGQAQNSPRFVIFNAADGTTGTSTNTVCLSVSGRVRQLAGDTSC